MEQPRHRRAASADGDDGPGRSPELPGAAERSGRAAGGSAAWNGTCGRAPAPGPGEEEEEEEEEEEDRDRDLPFPGADGPRRSCCCRRGEPAAPPSPAAGRRDGSCSLACRTRGTPSPGPPPRRGQEEGDEDGAGEDGAGRGGRRPRRRPRHRSAAKEKEESGRREGAPGKRPRPARKRSRGDGPEGPAGCRRLLAAALGRARRLGAGAGAWLLCSCCRLGAWALRSARAALRSCARRLGQRARSGSLRAARGLRAGAGLGLRVLGVLSARLLLLLSLLLGCLRLCRRLGGSRGAARLLELLDAPVLRRARGLLGDSRTRRRLWDWLRRRRVPPWLPGDAAAAGAAEELSRLLAMAGVPEQELNPFQVLGVEVTASDAELRKAYRRLAVLVHPDKNEHPGAEAAFKVLRAAWDMVSSPERRREYKIQRLAQSELTRSVSEFLSRLQDDLREAMDTMMCSKCQGKHRRFEMDRDPLSARYCAECGGRHPAEEGDFWAESSLLRLKITYYAMMDGKIYDITEWAGCQRVGIAPDTHRVPYHISCGSRGAGTAGRQRNTPKGSPPSASDLQDLFTRLFQGSSGPMPGGPFPASPGPPRAAASPGVPPRPEGAAPRGDTKHKRRKKVRRPLQR